MTSPLVGPAMITWTPEPDGLPKPPEPGVKPTPNFTGPLPREALEALLLTQTCGSLP